MTSRGGRLAAGWWMVLALCAGVAGVAGCAGRAETPDPEAEAKAEEPRPVKITVAPIDRRKVERTVPVTGTLRGWEDVSVGSKRAGRVVKVLHDMGDRVAPGEPLLELEPIDADLAVEQASRQLVAELAKVGLSALPGSDFDVTSVPAVVQARVSVDQAKRDLSRVRGLNQRGATSMAELQDAEDLARSAEANLAKEIIVARSTLANAQAAKVALDVAKQARVDTVIRVPVPTVLPEGHSGPVEYAIKRRDVSEGQMLQAGDSVFGLVIETPLRLWANIPEVSQPDVKLDQAVRVQVPAYPGKSFAGKVARINPAVDEVSRTFQVEIAVPNEEGVLRPGGFARASIITQTADEATVVPLEAIVEFVGVTKVFVREGDTVHALPVTKGVEGEGWIEVMGVLPSRGEVVTSGQSQLADGTRVVLRTEGVEGAVEPTEASAAAPAPTRVPAPAAETQPAS